LQKRLKIGKERPTLWKSLAQVDSQVLPENGCQLLEKNKEKRKLFESANKNLLRADSLNGL
jgi:hypothetical protein